jgi:hypothetical protein
MRNASGHIPTAPESEDLTDRVDVDQIEAVVFSTIPRKLRRKLVVIIKRELGLAREDCRVTIRLLASNGSPIL